MKIGYCFTGSFCTLERSFLVLSRLCRAGHTVFPIMSENAYYTDTRFALAEEFSRRVEELTGNAVIHTVRDAEPLGPKNPLDFMIAAPCTGNTLAKLSRGITDTAATMAMKAHLRSLGAKALVTNGNSGPHYAALQLATDAYDYIDDQVASVVRDPHNPDKNRWLHKLEYDALMNMEIAQYLRETFKFPDGQYKFGDINWQQYHKLHGTSPIIERW